MAKLSSVFQPIIGTWAMVEAWDIGDDPQKPNKKTYPWGNPPLGYWVYDKSGHFSLMISQNPALPIPTDPTTKKPDPGWLDPGSPWQFLNTNMIDSFVTAQPYAYFGTYRVVLTPGTKQYSGTIHHNVVSDVMRAYTGTIQKRPFVFDGNDIINIGVAGQYLRKLQRLT